jgi:hypothetical protein
MAVCLGKSIMLSPFPVSDPMQTGQEMACPTAVGGGLQLEPGFFLFLPVMSASAAGSWPDAS